LKFKKEILGGYILILKNTRACLFIPFSIFDNSLP